MQHVITEVNCETFRQNDTWFLSGIRQSRFRKQFKLFLIFLIPFSRCPSQIFISLTGGHLPAMEHLACISEVFFLSILRCRGVSQLSSLISNFIASVDSIPQSICLFNRLHISSFLFNKLAAHWLLMPHCQETNCCCFSFIFSSFTDCCRVQRDFSLSAPVDEVATREVSISVSIANSWVICSTIKSCLH